MDLSSLFTAQNRRLFKLTMPLKSGQELLLESFVGHEGLSMEFGFQLDLLSDDANVKLKTAMGQSAVVSKDICRNMDISRLLTPSNCQRLRNIDLRRGCELWSTTGSIDAAVQNLTGQTVKEYA
jgi:hypothetical protein